MGLTWLFAPARSLGHIADQAAGHPPALDLDADIDDAAKLWCGRGTVIVAGIPALTFAEMPLAGDQHQVQALAAVRSGEPLRAGACRDERNGVLMTLVPFPASTSGAVAGARQPGTRPLYWAVQTPAGWAVTVRMRTARARISLTDSTYTRLSQTVPAWRLQAGMPTSALPGTGT